MLTSLFEQGKSFYQLIQDHPELDLRDRRGKRHDLALVLTGLMLSLFRGCDGTLSGLHRSMKHLHESICQSLGVDSQDVISRSQLPIVLSKVDFSGLSKLFFEELGFELGETERSWFAADGKELRGSIDKGAKRGEAIVQAVEHQSRQVVASDFYNGRKQSEKPTLRKLLREHELLGQAISFDALHFSPATLIPIAKAGGWYLVGLKDNQKELEEDMAHHAAYMPHIEELTQVEKGHGRLESRHYKAFSIETEYVDPRWKDAEFRSLIQVCRTRTIIKTGKTAKEKAMYISNSPVHNAQELFAAVRNHWTVETNNYCRDVTLKEDKLRSKKAPSIAPWPHYAQSSFMC